MAFPLCLVERVSNQLLHVDFFCCEYFLIVIYPPPPTIFIYKKSRKNRQNKMYDRHPHSISFSTQATM